MNEKYDINLAKEGQLKLCEEKGYPHFAPYSGICWCCHKSIYEPIEYDTYVSGITVEEASTKLITGCPHCHRSYCD